ncbi:MAG: hypothetical protein HY014_16415 [Acidobacteria bacterium]|nr:hypothetical protein [Acidobacteriota bacterium]MBI3489715.1 hypothetical protein [Acidobacteriota bacterium]
MGTGRTIWQDVGFRYYAGMLLKLCLGPVDLLELKADGKSFWTGVSTGGVLNIDAPGLFGGEDSGGGLSGTINFLPGSLTHAVDPYLQSQLGSPLPAWRGVATLVWRGPSAGGENGYLGTSKRIAPISAVVRRLPSNLGLPNAVTNLNGDANAAEVIYELLTNPDCGMTQPASMIDLASFQAAANQLASEGLGISATWDNDRPVRDFMDDILRTIDGACFVDFKTGQWTFKLARGGYNIATLPVLDESIITILEGYSESAIDESTNQVQLTYTDRASGFVERQVQAASFSNIRQQDAVVNQALSYPMISRSDMAAKLADRDLRAICTSLAKGDLICNRVARNLLPGDVFVLRWGPLGLDQVVCRVLRTSRGTLKNRAIRISFLKDVFSLGQALYGAPAVSGWTNPIQDPAACPAQQLLEAPYHLTRQDAPKLLIMGQRPNGSCQTYDIWVKKTFPSADADFTYRGTGLAFAPVGTLTSAYGMTNAVDEVGFTVSGSSDLAALAPVLDSELRLGANVAYFESGEAIVFRQPVANGDGTWTLTGIWRGVFDTVPQAHAAGERIWFGAYGQASTDESFAAGDTLAARLLPSGFRGTLALASGLLSNLNLVGRAAKPYPPAGLTVNGLATLTTSVGDAAAAWVHRNRLTQALVVRQDDPGQAAPEGTYTVRAYVGGTLKRTFPGVVATSQVYTAAQRAADDVDGTKTVEISIQSVNGALTSVERKSPAFVMTGAGMTCGLYCGGIQG